MYRTIRQRFWWTEKDEWLWPDSDDPDRGLQAVIGTVNDLQPALERVTNYRQAVQAGGACGIWPLRLANQFLTVHTFEPDPANYYCLRLNANDPRVIAHAAGLGAAPGRGSVKRPGHETRNAGAGYVQEEHDGPVPIVTIDSLELDGCGLIQLDVEGSELQALIGADQTIRRCRPVIMLEEKALEQQPDPSQAAAWLRVRHGYSEAARVHRDVILVPPC